MASTALHAHAFNIAAPEFIPLLALSRLRHEPGVSRTEPWSYDNEAWAADALHPCTTAWWQPPSCPPGFGAPPAGSSDVAAPWGLPARAPPWPRAMWGKDAAAPPLSSEEVARAMAVSKESLLGVWPTEAGDGTVVKLVARATVDDDDKRLKKMKAKKAMRLALESAVCTPTAEKPHA